MIARAPRRLIEQAAALYPEFREFRRQLLQPFVDRIRSNIARMQSEGVANPDIDVDTTAHALVSMIDNFHYLWLVLDEPFDQETALRTIS